MTTDDQLRVLIANYEQISGIMCGSLVALVTSETETEAMVHAKAVEELGEGVNIAMTLLREFARSPKMIGHDWLAELMEPPNED